MPVGGPEDFNIVFVGAGNIMFGSQGDPWDHSIRFERKLDTRLRVVALIDPDSARATSQLEKKRASLVAAAYTDTRVCASLADFARDMAPHERPCAVIVGSPPMFRGSTRAGRDIELQVLKYFPGVALFVEKPVATGPFEEIADAHGVSKALKDAGTVCAVGYMLRYLKAVQMMKKIIEENNVTVMATVARYACAYTSIDKPDWWNKSRSYGPIIEQGTHFCDLSRYFGGEVDLESITAHSLEWDENAARLSKMPIDEAKIEPENRIPRVTSATWKYESGAVGSLTHVVALQGNDYSCELEVFADGYSLKLVNPYVQPTLYVRRPGDDHEEVHRFSDDDPFFSEVSNWVDVIEKRSEASVILSTFDDGIKTYEFTWAIRRASERSIKKNQKESSSA